MERKKFLTVGFAPETYEFIKKTILGDKRFPKTLAGFVRGLIMSEMSRQYPGELDEYLQGLSKEGKLPLEQ